jgi:hypothetical protein
MHRSCSISSIAITIAITISISSGSRPERVMVHLGIQRNEQETPSTNAATTTTSSSSSSSSCYQFLVNTTLAPRK